MADKRNFKPDDEEQSARFIEAAREHGVDETGEEFERVFKKIVPQKPGKRDTPPHGGVSRRKPKRTT